MHKNNLKNYIKKIQKLFTILLYTPNSNNFYAASERGLRIERRGIEFAACYC
jgi:hypothetical protein